MELSFNQRFNNDPHEFSITALINVIIDKPRRSLDYFPKFSRQAYEFMIEENLELNSIARNVSILVQSEYMTDFSSGFTLELLNKDFSLANDVFELVPKYGIGYLIASIKVKSVLDYEKGIRKYDFVVRIKLILRFEK
jgi:hypothetical protein